MTHCFHHFYGADGVKRRIADIAVVLQTQIGLQPLAGRDAQFVHSGIGIVQLFGAERDANDLGLEFVCGFFCQSAPTASYFQHTTATVHARHAQGALHFGGLRLFGGARVITFIPCARIVHGFVEPQLIKRVTQVVVRMDVFAAVAAAVVVQQVFDAIQQAPIPSTKHHGVNGLSVAAQEFQQLSEIGCAPIACDITFCKANVA